MVSHKVDLHQFTEKPEIHHFEDDTNFLYSSKLLRDINWKKDLS